VSSDSGTSWTDAEDDTEHTFTGLVNGQSYTCKVRAVNAAGFGAAATVTATPRTVPSAPQSLSATPGDRRVTLRWAAPASDGGAAIEKYQVSSDNGASWTDAEDDAEHTFTGLTNGQSYTCKARAVNSVGFGAEATITATPQAGLPPDPDYIPRTLTDSDAGITVSGNISEDAQLMVGDMRLGDTPACDEIRRRMADGDYVLLLGKNISLSGGFTGTLVITMPVDARYEGQTVTILHCAGGTLRTYTVTVTDGKVTFSVTSLSPFAVFAEVSAPPDDALPTVVTGAVTEVSATGAKLSGHVTAGGAAVGERGFVYGTVANPIIGGEGVTKVTAGTGAGSFTAALTGLEPDTVYYARAYAVGGEGTACGAAVRFRTDEDEVDGVPQTWDGSTPWVWWLLGGASAAGVGALVVLVVLGKRKRRSMK